MNLKKEGIHLFSFAIYTDNKETETELRSIIQDFLIETKIMAKVSSFNEEYKFITAPDSYDVYIMDMDSETDIIDLGRRMREIDTNGKFIYMCTDTSKAYLAARVRADYFIEKPIIKEELIEILTEIKKVIQEDTIIIKIPGGERKVRANTLNYINIVKRCLCYHMKDGNMFDGQVLRSSFEKAISPLQHHKAKSFLFLPPSLLINVGEIKIVNNDNIVFENDDVLYIPKKSYDIVREAWINYNRFVNL